MSTPSSDSQLPNLSGKTCLITGGAGFLGSNLARTLAERGSTVRVIDMVPAFEDDARIESIVGNILDPADVKKAVEGVDHIFHTVALIELSRHAPEKAKARVRKVNVEGTKSLIEAAVAAGVKTLVHTSSTATVLDEKSKAGGGEEQPYAPGHDLYAETKIAQEKMVLGENGKRGMYTAAVRPGGIYGPGERKQLFGTFIRGLKNGKGITVLGNGTSRLDYTHVESLCDAMIRATERLGPDSPVGGQAYFISDDQPMNHGEFYERIVKAMGMATEKKYLAYATMRRVAIAGERVYGTFGKPKPPITMAQLHNCTLDNYFSIEKARRDLDYKPLYDTDEGILTCIPDLSEYYESLERRY